MTAAAEPSPDIQTAPPGPSGAGGAAVAPERVFYRVLPGTDVVPVGTDLVLTSDGVTLRLEGESAVLFGNRVVPLLDGTRSLAEVAADLPGLAPGDLQPHLDALVDARVLGRRDAPTPPSGAPTAPLLRFAESTGLSAERTDARLKALRVAVFGLEGPGAHVAAALAASGVGTILVVDPYPAEPGNLPLMGPAAGGRPGAPRQRLVGDALAGVAPGVAVVTGGDGPVDRDSVGALCTDCDLVIGCFDKGFSATNVWINDACVELGAPALYAQLRGPTAWVGPLVVPGETACYLCWRMRAIACDQDFMASMAVEEFLDGQRRPALHERGAIPALAPMVGGMLALGAVNFLLGLGRPALAGHVQEVDALRGCTTSHAVLAVSDCPVCKKKSPSPPAGPGRPSRPAGTDRAHPPLAELIRPSAPPGDIVVAAGELVSGRCGIVRVLEEIPQDLSEPARPYVWRGEIANHRFAPRRDPEQAGCAGKGMTVDAAMATALGEAVERYSSGCWEPEEVVYGTRGDLGVDALDPRELVLFRPEQYGDVPYAPYRDDTVLGWVPARSLVTGATVLVPALPVFMSYHPLTPGEHILPTTSNGLAAGPTAAHAVLGGLLEVLERDAFIITWMNRLPAAAVDPRTHPDPDVVGLWHAFDRRGVRLHLLRLPTDHPAHVFMGMAVADDATEGPAAVVGLGADVDAARAARKAAMEVAQIRPAMRAAISDPELISRRHELVEDPHRVADLEDHDLLYTDRRMLPSLGFLLDREPGPYDWPGAGGRDDAAPALSGLVDHLGAAGGDVLSCDLTPPEMARLGLHTARVIVPGFQPIHFGWKETRLGGRRLFELPHRLGFRATPASPADLNDDPHPLA